MDRNTVTTADKLELGDRFYFANDKNKVVWQKVEHEIKVTHFQTYKHWCILASVADNPKMHPTAKATYVKPMRKETKVVFLRRVEG